MDVTYWKPEWRDGLPPDGEPREWLGLSADGRYWILQWWDGDQLAVAHWGGMGWSVDKWHPECRLMKGENASFIVQHMTLPLTDKELDTPTIYPPMRADAEQEDKAPSPAKAVQEDGG